MIKLYAPPKVISAAKQAYLILEAEMAVINVSHNVSAALLSAIFLNFLVTRLWNLASQSSGICWLPLPYASCLYIDRASSHQGSPIQGNPPPDKCPRLRLPGDGFLLAGA